ncbi:MAG: hypothetical protein OXE99_01470 [Cellvibrionales bacterium]|nr:hypothetical protein [Cellvibrionales bacterium]
MKPLLIQLAAILAFACPASFIVADNRIEDFANADWQNHQDLGEFIETNDLRIAVNPGGSLKALTTPNGLQLGYLKSSDTHLLRITPSQSPYFDVKSIEATDLWQMAEPTVIIKGYRDDTLIAELTSGPLWDNALNTGITQLTQDFNGLTHLDIHANTAPIENGDLYFILESIEYQLNDSLPAPPTTEPSPTFPFLGSIDLLLLFWTLGLITLRRSAKRFTC